MPKRDSNHDTRKQAAKTFAKDHVATGMGINTIYIKDIQIPSKHNKFIIIYHFRATCFDSLESSSGPLMN